MIISMVNYSYASQTTILNVRTSVLIIDNTYFLDGTGDLDLKKFQSSNIQTPATQAPKKRLYSGFFPFKIQFDSARFIRISR